MANKIFGIFGVGAFGLEICRVMTQNGANVVVFDNDPKVINNILIIVGISIKDATNINTKNAIFIRKICHI